MGAIAYPETREESPVEELPLVCYFQQALGDIIFEVSYLYMLAHVLYRLESIGKISIPTHQYRGVVETCPGETKQIRGQHNINSLFHRDALSQLRASQPDFKIGHLMQGFQEFLLLVVSLRILALFLKDIVVIYPKQLPLPAEFTGKFGEVEVIAIEITAQGMV